MSTVMVVCDVYELLKQGKSFTKQGKVIKTTNSVVQRSWAESKNDDWQNAGLWYDIDEQRTKEYYEKGALKRANRNKAQKIKKQLTETLTDVIETANKVVEKEVEEDDEELAELKAKYIEKFDKKPHYKWGIEKLTEKLQ